MTIPTRRLDGGRTVAMVVALVAATGCVQETIGDSADAGVAVPPVDAPPVVVVPPIDGSNAPPAQCTQVQLLRNPTFDDAPTAAGWTITSTAANDPIITDAVGVDAPAAHSPSLKAYFGGIDGVRETLHQDVAVPLGTTQVVLSGQVHVWTTETGSAQADEVWIEVVGLGSDPVELVHWLNTDATTGWTPFSVAVTVPPGALFFRLRFGAYTDAQRWTSFLFDSLALTAITCP
jgi:hypothetical protein